jgi:rhomboid family protein
VNWGRGGRVPVVTLAIVVVNVWVFGRERAAGAGLDSFLNAFAAIPYDITHGIVLGAPSPGVPLLTVVTSMFVHVSPAHIGFNMLFLIVVGPAVEYLCGHLRFAVLYLACGIAGAGLAVLVDPASHVPMVGASGAIAGVLGAYLVYPLVEVNTIVPIPLPHRDLRLAAVLLIGFWALTQFLNGLGTMSARAAESTGGTAYFAHIGGFCAGVLLIGLMKIRR